METEQKVPKFKNHKGLAATIQIALYRFCLLNAAQRKLNDPAPAKAGEIQEVLRKWKSPEI